MPITRHLIQQVRQLDPYDLRRLRILIRDLLEDMEPPPGVQVGREPKVTYRQQMVRCGKERCRSCPHGPYWYAYWREDGRLRSRYVGKELPEGVSGD